MKSDCFHFHARKRNQYISRDSVPGTLPYQNHILSQEVNHNV